MASSHNTFISREEYRTKKALDEARKAGKLPAEVDEDGKEINPHMPQYIIQAPWYLNQMQPSLKHQKKVHMDEKRTKIDNWYPKGARSDQVATKFRKGACENCGALTHQRKDCMDRPRRVGAKFTGQDIQGDEVIVNIDLDYDAKRDRWNGYDPNMYLDVIKEHELYDAERKKIKQKDIVDEDFKKKENVEDQEDDYKLHDFESAVPVPNKDPKIKTTIRNLRIREDTAKYLLNLEESAPYYDPKSRSMRENPLLHLPPEQQNFKGDNNVRYTGQTMDILEQEKFVWDLVEKSNAELNTVGLPSGTELFFKKLREQKQDLKSFTNNELLKTYGGEEHLKLNYDLIFSQSEKYVEFSRDGKPILAFDKQRGKSKYDEDVFIRNHMSVWGSWWSAELGWGYQCCHTTEKHSNCLGERGKRIAIQKEYKIVKAREEELYKLKDKLEKDDDPKESVQLLKKENSLNLNTTADNLEEALAKPLKLGTSASKNSSNSKKKAQTQNSEEESSSTSESESGSSSSSGTSSIDEEKSESESSSGSSEESSSSSSGSSESDSGSSSASSKKRVKKESVKKSKNGKKEASRKTKDGEGTKKPSKRSKKLVSKPNKRRNSDSEEELDPKKLKKCLKKEDEAKKNKEFESDDRKRPYNSLRANVYEVSKEEIEAYRMKKQKFDDPLYKPQF